MTRLNWTPQDQREHDAAVSEAWESSTRQTDRTIALGRRVRDAEQAHRVWAVDYFNEALHIGFAVLLKRAHDQMVETAKVNIGEDRLVEKRRTLGVIEKATDGSQAWTQLEFDNCTVEQLRAKNDEISKVTRANRERSLMIARLIALCEEAGAETPREAALILGVTVDEWLSRAS